MWGFREVKSTELDRQPEEWESRARFLEVAVRNLIILTKDFAFDLDELQTPAFKAQLDTFLEELPKEWRPRALENNFRTRQNQIQDFSKRQRSYIEEKEAEFRQIIDTLVSGLAKAGAESDEFCKTMESCGQALEKVAKLDDIRKLREALNQQIGVMSQEIRQKRDRDAKALEQLRKKVSNLHLELKTAVKEGRACPLTHVGNRRAFDESLQNRYEHCCLVWKPFALILMDIDNFKKINDTFGHTAGDRVLTNVARALSKQIRSDDMVTRYGGEEFAVILGSATLRGAKKCARKLVKMIDKLAFLSEDGVEIPVTISAGIAMLKQEDTPESLIRRADEALYAAKANGKNQAVCEQYKPKSRSHGMGRMARGLLETFHLV